jgi:hypothetical protein
VDWSYRHDSLWNSKGDRDPEQSSGFISAIEVNLPDMILDNLLGYRQAQSAALGLSVANEGLENGVLNPRGNAGAVIPDRQPQAGSISGAGYDDVPRVRRNRLEP